MNSSTIILLCTVFLFALSLSVTVARPGEEKEEKKEGKEDKKEGKDEEDDKEEGKEEGEKKEGEKSGAMSYLTTNALYTAISLATTSFILSTRPL